jgi:TonB family protein
MALTGELSDLSLAELIEIFCNQRKTGRLTVEYKPAHGHFYIHKGDLVDAELGPLTGVDAIYYALTLPSASFVFDTKIMPSRRIIIESWRAILLEGLRRLDEGIIIPDPFIGDKGLVQSFDLTTTANATTAVANLVPYSAPETTEKFDTYQANGHEAHKSDKKPTSEKPASGVGRTINERPRLVLAGAVGGVLLLVTVIGVVSGSLNKSAASNAPTTITTDQPNVVSSESKSNNSDVSLQPATAITPVEATSINQTVSNTTVTDQSSNQSEPTVPEQSKNRRSASDVKGNRWQAKAAKTTQNKKANVAAVRAQAVEDKTGEKKSGPKTVAVNVMVDEHGRVAQAVVLNQRPGMAAVEAAAVRAARQRRYEPGRSKWITVPIQVN